MTRCFSRRLRPQALVEIHGEQRGRRVEQRGERAHQRGEHSREHEALEAHGQEVRHENRKRALRIRLDRLEARRALLPQRHGDHARQQEDEHRRELEVAREQRAAARFLQVPRREHALHDVLIRAPVPQPDDRRGRGARRATASRWDRTESPENPAFQGWSRAAATGEWSRGSRRASASSPPI